MTEKKLKYAFGTDDTHCEVKMRDEHLSTDFCIICFAMPFIEIFVGFVVYGLCSLFMPETAAFIVMAIVVSVSFIAFLVNGLKISTLFDRMYEEDHKEELEDDLKELGIKE